VTDWLLIAMAGPPLKETVVLPATKFVPLIATLSVWPWSPEAGVIDVIVGADGFVTVKLADLDEVVAFGAVAVTVKL
jgi:hypothetical protein